jgi:exonuclease V
MATKHEENYTITRVTRHILKPFNEVMSKLESSIDNSPEPMSILRGDALKSKEAYEEATNKKLGPHDFMQFLQIKHGAWMGLYGVHVGKQATRVIFGNPQVAITMLEHDVRAGLFVPVEALVLEREDGDGTDVIMVKPSSLIAGGVEGEQGRKLRESAEKLDEKVEKLWSWVAE